MKNITNFNKLLGTTLLCFCYISSAAEDVNKTLKDSQTEIDELTNVPNNDSNVASPNLLSSSDYAYIVQTRKTPLNFRNELSVGGTYTAYGSEFTSSKSLFVNYHLHVTPRFSLLLGWDKFYNKETNAANQVIDKLNIYPDLLYIQNAYDVAVKFRPFYGKIRITLNTVVHFDYYLSAGWSTLLLNTSNERANAFYADTGFEYWIGNHMTARLGLKDHIYKDPYDAKKKMSNLQLGLSLGAML